MSDNRILHRSVGSAALLTVALVSSPEFLQADCRPTYLRCEYRTNPLGVDVTRPRLSWVLKSDERGQGQSAYRILVARQRETLANDAGDLWDSGRVDSDRPIQILYQGKPLTSRMHCWWKVQVWDKENKPSAWSEPANWLMGLLQASDWKAKWITDPKAARHVIPSGHNGYHSRFADAADKTKWIAVDLGGATPIDSVQLYPSRPYSWGKDIPGYLFPLRFKVELSQSADFSDARVVVDRTAQDVPLPQAESLRLAFPTSTARYVRLAVTRMRAHDQMHFGFTLAEFAIFAGKQNVALKGSASGQDSVEVAGWSAKNLNDGLWTAKKQNRNGHSAVLLRKKFSVGASIQRASLSVTALGLYEMRINGRRVGDHLLAPGWTDYNKRVQVQTYDVTSLVRRGSNAMAATLGNGWYAGRLGLALAPGRCIYGTHPKLLAELEIERTDGTRQIVATDATWKTSQDGPIRANDLLDGEVYDARKEMPGWDQPGYDDSTWSPAHVSQDESRRLVWQPSEPIRLVKDIKSAARTEPSPGVYVFDLGQNIAGKVRMRLDGRKGTTVVLRHAERLKADGTLYTANLRGSPQRDVCILNGGSIVFEPQFTYHGFRYVEVTGLEKPPALTDLVGLVFHSASPVVGQFRCSHPLVEQVMRNVLWSQRGNLMSIATDCPQRDERLGWMGDIQVFSQTSCFNMDMAGFFTKSLRDVGDAQAADGQLPDFAPHPYGPKGSFYGSPGEADGGVLVPWRVYQNYADTRILEEHFDVAVRWIEHIRRHNPDGLWRKSRGRNYGEWLNGDTLRMEGYPSRGGALPTEIYATLYYARSVDIVSRMARVLGRQKEADQYSQLFVDIRAAFQRAYVAKDARIQGDTQAGYAMALHFNLLKEENHPPAMGHLLHAIDHYHGRLSTGIYATRALMLELSRRGKHQQAWKLFNLRDAPSWGYMIDSGATTIWERWDAYIPGRGYQNPFVNSLNHYAFGAVGEWVWRNLVGINPDDRHPGYQHIIIRPQLAAGLSWVEGVYDSIRGPISVDWKVEAGQIDLKVAIPPGTTATVYVPTTNAAAIRETGRPAGESPGVRYLNLRDHAGAFAIVSGTYRFTGPYKSPNK